MNTPEIRARGAAVLTRTIRRAANLRWGLIAALLGLPLPIILLAFLFGGCNR
jgi:hypothetical protein